MHWWRYTHGGNRDQGFFLLHKNPRKEEQAGRQLPGGDFTARAGGKNFPEKSNGPEHLNDLVSLSAGELRPREDLLPCAWRSFPSRRRPRCGRPASTLRRHVNNFSRARLLSPLSAFLFLFLAAAALPLLSRGRRNKGGICQQQDKREANIRGKTDLYKLACFLKKKKLFYCFFAH